MIVDINKDFKFRRFQIEIVKRWSKVEHLFLMVSRQHGKTLFGIMALIDFIFRFNKRKNPSAMVVMTTAEQAYSVYFKRADDILKKLPTTLYTKQGSVSSGLMRVTLRRPWFKDSVTIEIAGAGNPKAIKGRTLDLAILDEAAFVDRKIWFECLEPALDDVNGKGLITSTVNGLNWFYNTSDTYKELYAEGSQKVACLEYDDVTARLRPASWRKEKADRYKRLGLYHIYLQEYKNDPFALASEQVPYSRRISELKLQNIHTPSKVDFEGDDLFLMKEVVVSIDMGKPGNNPVWCWYYNNKGVHIIHYKDDDESNYAVLDRLYKQFPNQKIKVVYPEDVAQPSLVEGKSRFDLLKTHVRNRGYSNRMSLTSLPRTKSRKELLRAGLELFQDAQFDLKETREGLKRLAGATQRKDATTKEVKFGDFIPNGNQHAADAFNYIAAAINNGIVKAGSQDISLYPNGHYKGWKSLKYD